MRPLKIKTSYTVDFSPDSECCLTLARDVSLWSLQTRKKIWRSHPFSHPSDACFSPDGSLIAVKSTSGQIVVVDREKGHIVRDFKNQSEGEGSNIAFSACGEYLVDGSWDGQFTARNILSGEIGFRQSFGNDMLCHVQVVGTGNHIVTEHRPKATTDDKPPDDAYLLRWTWPLGIAEPCRLPIRIPLSWAVALDESGKSLAVVFGPPPDELHMYDTETGRVRWTSDVSQGRSVKWSHGGQYVGVVQREVVTVHDATDGRTLLEHSLPYPSDVSFSATEELIAYGSWEAGEIRRFEFK